VPEGDTIFRAARTLHRALAGRTVERFASVFPALTRVDEDEPLAGRTVAAVTSRGKHLLMSFSGGLTLHTHMRMNGSWHVYRTGEAWQRPARDMRVLIATDPYIAVGFNVPVAEFLTAEELRRHRGLGTLGPDLAADHIDHGAVRAAIVARGGTPIADVLLDQRVVAGVGNVLKSEILFVAGVDPFAAARDLPDAVIASILNAGVRLMAVNVAEGGSRAAGRRTTGRLNPAEKLWVYGRGGEPCRRCAETIRSRKTGLDARITYWCPNCQRQR
jgi:endonuclease-8